MRYIKSYSIFEAESTIDPEIDVSQIQEDPKLNAENDEVFGNSVKDIQSKITEYNTKKASIDAAYKLPDDYQVKLKVEKILGKDMKKRNEFLVQYDKFCSMDRNLAKLQKANVDDTTSISKYNKELQSFTDMLRMDQNVENQEKIRSSIQKTTEAINQFKLNISTNNKMIPKIKQALLGKKTFIDSMKLKLNQINNIKATK